MESNEQPDFLLMPKKGELDKSVVMAWVGSPAVTNESIFRIRVHGKISSHFPEKNITESVTRDMAYSDWLKLVALCLFRKQSVSKNK